MNIDPNILNTFLTLMASVGILGLLLFFVKKTALNFKKRGAESNLEVLSKLSLSQKNNLFIVKAKNKTLLIGVSEKNINLISELETDNSAVNLHSDQILNKIKNTNKTESNVNSDLSFKAFLKSAILKNN